MLDYRPYTPYEHLEQRPVFEQSEFASPAKVFKTLLKPQGAINVECCGLGAQQVFPRAFALG